MSRRKGIPGYCRHKGTGQAYATVNGKEVYLGAYGSAESRRAYAELIARLEAGGATPRPAALTVVQLVARYDDFAESYYRKSGEPTRQIERVRRSLGVAVKLYGSTPAAGFGPVALAACREHMVGLGWSRKHVNACVGCVRRCWRWAAAAELVPASVYQALATLDGLRAGRTKARETAPVGPVADDVAEATLAKLGPVVADMVRLQLLTGMRAGEVCALKAEEIDRSGEVWTWTMSDHKTLHHGKGRVIYLGPKAQALLASHLAACGGGHVFSPRRAARSCRVGPRSPGECYTSNSYQKAINRACARAGVPPWASNQLRKSAATRIRAEFGLDVAQAILGHSRVETTQIYASKTAAAAVAAMLKVG
jgi:integrase